MVLDRKTAPPLQDITNLQLPPTELIHLDNGIPVYITRAGTQPIVKMELVIQAGRWLEEKKLVSRMTAQLMKEGTRHRSGEAIAEWVDFYGGVISFPADLDTSNLVLLCLTKHFDKLLPLVDEILTAPAFDEADLAKLKRRSQRQLKMDLGKVDVVAYRQITEAIFGKKHPYGYNSQARLFDKIEHTDILQHFEQHYRAGNVKIFLSGRPTADVLENLNRTLGRNLPQGVSSRKPIVYNTTAEKIIHTPKKNSVQSAIRIGCRTFTRTHEDHQGLYILNTILGGYFGARLMTNLREDKGFTYGVYSSLEPMMYDGYFNVSTEVAKGKAQEALDEIYKEFERLRTELIGAEELKMVQNYLLGYMLTGLDGPFNAAEIVRTLVTENAPLDDFEKMVETIRSITPQRLLELANKYLDRNNMYEVIVG
jgi:zinc protease